MTHFWKLAAITIAAEQRRGWKNDRNPYAGLLKRRNK